MSDKNNENIENKQEENLNKPEGNKNWWKKLLGFTPIYGLLKKTIFILVFISFIVASAEAKVFKYTINNPDISIEIKKMAEMAEPRSNAAVIELLNGEFLIFGGFRRIHEDQSYLPVEKHKTPPPHIDTLLKTAEIYNVKKNKFRKIQNMIHTEYVGTYQFPNGNILLISKDNPCQIYNCKTESFSVVYNGIKDIPDDSKNLFIIKVSEEKLLLFDKKFTKIIELNPETGKYKTIYKNNKYKFIYVIPFNNNEVIGIINNNETENLYNEVMLFNISNKKYEKITELKKQKSNIMLEKINSNKVLVYATGGYSIGFEYNDLIIDIKEKDIKLSEFPKNIKKMYGNRKGYFLKDNLIFFNLFEIYDLKNLIAFNMLDTIKNLTSDRCLLSFNAGIIHKGNNIYLFGGQRFYSSMSNSSLVKISIKRNINK